MRSISEADLVDLHGKVALVTGGNTGIGYATIQMLARKGAKVYMGARDQERAEAAIQQLEAEGISDGSVHWLKLDLSDVRRVREAVASFCKKEERLDVLVNNAAKTFPGPYRVNDDGFLDIMAVNHIGHFALTQGLLPLMIETAKRPNSDVRIVNVSSVAHTQVKPTTFATRDALNKNYGDSVMGTLNTYGNTKLANILHMKELQKRLAADSVPITCISVHPGSVKTTGSDHFLGAVPCLGWLFRDYIGPLFFGPWRNGAIPVVFAAAGAKVVEDNDKYRGAYLIPPAALSQPSKYALDERLQKELFDTTETILTELN
ncbi:unnamed protein product [Mycena citricolor]|uniref:Uncharacterized protein n=1 Tax=Mycena citricolor TaxID=2018698 RepID=A0AAD2K311_9AGAR|nr:unnamed protein product [Mycena citricolor]